MVHEVGRDRGRAQYVQADKRQRSIRSGARPGRQFDHRARLGDAVQPREYWIECFVEAERRDRLNLKVGFTIDDVHRPAEFVQCGCVDEINREAERDADRDGQRRHDHAPGIGSPFAEDHPAHGYGADAI